jgi:hypothetical protein
MSNKSDVVRTIDKAGEVCVEIVGILSGQQIIDLLTVNSMPTRYLDPTKSRLKRWQPPKRC